MDISYEMHVKDRRFEAAFYQLTDRDKDTTGFAQWATDYMFRNYSEEERQNMTFEQTQALGIELAFIHYWQKASHRLVWFYIDEGKYGKYRIVLFYDNERNRSNGGDL